MSIQVSRVPSTGGPLATAGVTVHGIHWVGATAAAGLLQLRDSASATGAVVIALDLPQAKAAGDLRIGGGGIRFAVGAFATLGPVSIVYKDV